MLTVYNGDVFRVDNHDDKMRIWKYAPVDGFQKYTTKRGIAYYYKDVEPKTIGLIFDVEFFGFKDYQRFVITGLKDDTATAICDDAKYSEEHRYYEIDRGVWTTSVNLDEFKAFKMIIRKNNSKNKVAIKINKTEFLNAWEKYKKDLSI